MATVPRTERGRELMVWMNSSFFSCFEMKLTKSRMLDRSVNVSMRPLPTRPAHLLFSDKSAMSKLGLMYVVPSSIWKQGVYRCVISSFLRVLTRSGRKHMNRFVLVAICWSFDFMSLVRRSWAAGTLKLSHSICCTCRSAALPCTPVLRRITYPARRRSAMLSTCLHSMVMLMPSVFCSWMLRARLSASSTMSVNLQRSVSRFTVIHRQFFVCTSQSSTLVSSGMCTPCAPIW
mmetsp:Transcript_44470/g.85064  ORF Transcript_44470/g.85064 Transcript_44470/m.85064 type:complete len:233 (+) Transcript_44470:1148-1846(+)